MQNKALTPEVDIIDDKPDEVKADLRKFNKAEDQVNKALAALSTVTEIKDQAGVDTAMDIMKKAKKVETLIENKRKDLVKPYNDEVKRINEYAKSLIGKIPPAIENAKGVVLEFQKTEEKRQKSLRTQARHEYLISIGYTPGKESEPYTNEPGQRVFCHHVEDLDDQQWNALLKQLADELAAKAQAKIDALKNDLESADFFGDTEAKEAISQQMDAVNNEAVQPVAQQHVPAFGSTKVKGLTKRWTFDIQDASVIPREFLQVDEKKIREAIAGGQRSIPGVRIYQDESITLR